MSQWYADGGVEVVMGGGDSGVYGVDNGGEYDDERERMLGWMEILQHLSTNLSVVVAHEPMVC